MNLHRIVEFVGTKSRPHSRGSKPPRGETWDTCKDEIYRIYMTERNTLPKTMEIFEKDYGFKAW